MQRLYLLGVVATPEGKRPTPATRRNHRIIGQAQKLRPNAQLLGALGWKSGSRSLGLAADTMAKSLGKDIIIAT